MHTSTFSIEASAVTDRGRVRDNNEDNYSINESLGLFIVSDGIGGGAAGEKASEFVVNSIPLQVRAAGFEKLSSLSSAAESFALILSQMSQALYQSTSAVPEYAGAGATVVASLVYRDRLIIAHLGDSRAYRLRKGVFERLTEDHTVLTALQKTGKVTVRDMKNHPSRSVLTQYMGMKTAARPSVSSFAITHGDQFLLCTDGLTGMISERAAGTVLMGSLTLEEKARSLVSQANEAGGRDNVTVLLLSFSEPWAMVVRADSRLRVKREIAPSEM